MHKFQHEHRGWDTLKAAQLPSHIELSHSSPTNANKNLTAAVKDGQTFNIGIGLTAHPDHCCFSGDITCCLGNRIQPHSWSPHNSIKDEETPLGSSEVLTGFLGHAWWSRTSMASSPTFPWSRLCRSSSLPAETPKHHWLCDSWQL